MQNLQKERKKKNSLLKPVGEFSCFEKKIGGFNFCFQPRFPVEKDAKKRRNLFLERRLLGAVGNALTLTRDHVLLLFGCPSADKIVRRLRPSLWATRQPEQPRGARRNPRNRPIWPLSSVVGAVAATLARLG